MLAYHNEQLSSKFLLLLTLSTFVGISTPWNESDEDGEANEV
jgi:hypothetical protein